MLRDKSSTLISANPHSIDEIRLNLRDLKENNEASRSLRQQLEELDKLEIQEKRPHEEYIDKLNVSSKSQEKIAQLHTKSLEHSEEIDKVHSIAKAVRTYRWTSWVRGVSDIFFPLLVSGLTLWHSNAWRDLAQFISTLIG